MWAEELGNDLYRIRNIPLHAYGLNFYDVVFAKANSPDLKPSIVRVHETSGHKTLRVIFINDSDLEQRIELLTILNKYHAYHENADGSLFAIDVEPEGNYGKVCDILYEWEQKEILSYETCEARLEGRFDAE